MRDCATEGVFLEEPARKQAALWECYRGLPRPSSAVGMLPRAGRRQQSAAGSHEVQRGEDAELRGQAAGQAVILKLPAARGAPEVDERVNSTGRWRARVPALRATVQSPLATPHPRRGQGSHPCQHGHGAELRGQAATQAVAAKGPASETGTNRR